MLWAKGEVSLNSVNVAASDGIPGMTLYTVQRLLTALGQETAGGVRFSSGSRFERAVVLAHAYRSLARAGAPRALARPRACTAHVRVGASCMWCQYTVCNLWLH